MASFVNGVGWATDNPVRRVMIGEVVGSQQMGVAMSIDVGTNNASRMLGPTVGGILFASVGVGGAFVLSVALYATSLLAVLGLRYRNRQVPRDGGSVLARMRDGLALVRQDRRLIGVLVITVIYNVFAWPFTSMVPVIAQDRLHLTPAGIGLMASMDGVGAFIGATVIALFVGPRFYARTYLAGVISYMVMLTVFALVAQPISAATALVLTGVGGAAFSIMQATQVYLCGTGRDAQPRAGRAVGLHRRGPDRLRASGAAGGRDRRAVGDRDDGDRGVGGAGADLPLVAGHSVVRRAGSTVYLSRTSRERSASGATRVRVAPRAPPSPASQVLRDLSREVRERCIYPLF